MATDRFVFAHLADAHVGAWPRQPAFRSALRTCVLKALAKAEERRVEFLLISGDLFHTPTPDPTEVAPVAAQLRALVDRGTRIYAIYGSHDYVAHRTSWLDVLAEAGVFARVAPEAIRAEGTRWTLPYLVDAPTGARIAGVSGRSHGLDREYYRGMDAEAFRAEPGFHIFQFHAAVEEYLPEEMRRHIAGIRRDDLPPGCQYYAGGHIHQAYTGEGPTGGLLVNPGTLFGTSRNDLDFHRYDAGRHGLALVEVRDGSPRLEYYDPYPEANVRSVDIDLTGRTPQDVRQAYEQALARHRGGSDPISIRFTGKATGASFAEYDIAASTATAGVESTRLALDLEGAEFTVGANESATTEAAIEAEEFSRLLAESSSGVLGPDAAAGARRLEELLSELGTARQEGESPADYQEARREGALRLLQVRRAGAR